jgi:murein DD-endopeptidase MepM/ murein hydrolase activator NlpD
MLYVAILLSAGLAATTLDVQQEGRNDMALFLKADDDASRELFGRMSPEMKKVIPDAESLTKFSRGLIDSLGAEETVVRERTFPVGDAGSYLRVSRFKKSAEPILTLWTYDAKGTVLGLFVRPQSAGAAATRHDDYRTKTPLRLPVEGAWFTFWGGHNAVENYHAVDRGQRFAYDLLILKDGRSHEGDGSKVEQFFAFGKPIYSPADGVVVATESSLPDMIPGKMDPAHAMGNHVIVDHGNGEFSFLCHLRKGSVNVKPGDKVSKGREIARCGNSGNTSEPHLHYHLQDTGRFGDGDGLPAQFRDVIIDGKAVATGEPVRGQTVAPKP